MRASKMAVNVHMPTAQKRSLQKLAAGLGVTLSAYARIAVETALRKPGMDGIVKKIAYGKTPRERCDAQFRFAVSRTHYEEARRRADALGVAVSAYMRAMLSIAYVPAKGACPPEDVVEFVDVAATRKDLRAIRSELARIGNNVNQIAFGINLMNKKSWLAAREAESLFSCWAESTERAQGDLDKIAHAVDGCLAILSEASDDFALVESRP